MKRYSSRTVLLLLFIVLICFPLMGQVQTGNIFGTVASKDGTELPGVTVTLTGVGAPQSSVTDAQGKFRFINLSPGTYSLKADLAGYGTASRSGVSVNIGRNADVTMVLNPSISESITVTGEAPLLDTRKAGTGATLSRVELENVPTGRDPWVILQQTPGVLVDRVNVGGNESGQQSQYVGKGSGGDQATWNVDGVNITDVGAPGSSPTYYDFDSFEEMQVTTGGTDVRTQTPGVQLNMVTKRGTNDLSGAAKYFNTSGDMQADREIPAEARTYLGAVNEIDNIQEYGFDAGGPIIRDRLWLWGAYSKQNIDLLPSAGVRADGTVPARRLDETLLETFNVKLNAQPIAANSFSFAAMQGDKIKLLRNLSPTRPAETAWNQGASYEGPTMWKVEDTHIFSPNFYATGLYSRTQGGFQLISDNGKGCQTIDCGLDSLPNYYGINTGRNFRTYYSYITERPQEQIRGDASAFTQTGSVSHELRFGFGSRNAEVSSFSAWPGDYIINYSREAEAGTPGAIGLVGIRRPADFTYTVDVTDFYVGDTMLFGAFTVVAGARFDKQVGAVQPGTIAAHSLAPEVFPALTYGGTTEDLTWETISPRLGVTYAFGNDRRTLVRAALNRYVDSMAGSTVYAPAPTTGGYVYYLFSDTNGDILLTPDEIDFSRTFGFSNWNPDDPASVDEFYRYDQSMSPPHTDEVILGVEREVMTDFSLGANVTFRRMENQVFFRPEKTKGAGDYYTRADYVLASSPLTGALPSGSAYSVPYYELAAGIDPATYRVITNLPGYSQSFTGLELNGLKRFSNRWMMRANLSFMDWQHSIDDDAVGDPTRLRGATGCYSCDGSAVLQGSGAGSGPKGGVYINAKWAYNVTGTYLLPFVETNLGFNLTGRQGYPIPNVHSVDTSEGTKYVLIGDADSERHEDIHALDLRLAREFRWRGVGLIVSADVFNVLNSDTVLQRNTLVNSTNSDGEVTAGTPGRISEILSPRVIRLGARFTF